MSHDNKRPRLSPDASAAEPRTTPKVWSLETSTAAEKAVGITEYLTPDLPGFTGILKQRYTDFLVNEIDGAGNVVHLTNLNAPSSSLPTEPKEPSPEPIEIEEPKPSAPSAPKEATPEAIAELTALTDADTAAAIAALLVSAESGAAVTTHEIKDKDTRSKFHNTVREAFNSRLLTVTEGNTIIVRKSNSASRQGDRRRSNHRGGKNRANQSWQALGGEYCHFTVYKENRDDSSVCDHPDETQSLISAR